MSLFRDRQATRMMRAIEAQKLVPNHIEQKKGFEPQRETRARRTYHRITPDLILQVKRMWSNDRMQTQISDTLGLSPTTVNRICRGKYDDRIEIPAKTLSK